MDMKNLQPCLLLSLLLLFITRFSYAADWQETYDGLLQKYVTAEGVKYASWHAASDDRQALKTVVDAIGKAEVSALEKSDQLAFYVNAYNAWILYRILEEYPTAGPGGGGFFGRSRFFKARNLTVAGEETSFHLLENEVIRPRFKEPRVHFALNCASASCPPLDPHAFVGEQLEETLDRLAKAFINENDEGVKVTGKKVALSKIFEWYEEDFSPDVLSYVNSYRVTALPATVDIRYQRYRWTLNEAP
ncbi:MAG: hypothetical protein ACI9QL_001586 [Candidatus Omnitrophota bacterium]|jgi:hypothetical protein